MAEDRPAPPRRSPSLAEIRGSGDSAGAASAPAPPAEVPPPPIAPRPPSAPPPPLRTGPAPKPDLPPDRRPAALAGVVLASAFAAWISRHMATSVLLDELILWETALENANLGDLPLVTLLSRLALLIDATSLFVLRLPSLLAWLGGVALLLPALWRAGRFKGMAAGGLALAATPLWTHLAVAAGPVPWVFFASVLMARLAEECAGRRPHGLALAVWVLGAATALMAWPPMLALLLFGVAAAITVRLPFRRRPWLAVAGLVGLLVVAGASALVTGPLLETTLLYAVSVNPALEVARSRLGAGAFGDDTAAAVLAAGLSALGWLGAWVAARGSRKRRGALLLGLGATACVAVHSVTPWPLVANLSLAALPVPATLLLAMLAHRVLRRIPGKLRTKRQLALPALGAASLLFTLAGLGAVLWSNRAAPQAPSLEQFLRQASSSLAPQNRIYTVSDNKLARGIEFYRRWLLPPAAREFWPFAYTTESGVLDLGYEEGIAARKLAEHPAIFVAPLELSDARSYPSQTSVKETLSFDLQWIGIGDFEERRPAMPDVEWLYHYSENLREDGRYALEARLPHLNFTSVDRGFGVKFFEHFLEVGDVQTFDRPRGELPELVQVSLVVYVKGTPETGTAMVLLGAIRTGPLLLWQVSPASKAGHFTLSGLIPGQVLESGGALQLTVAASMMNSPLPPDMIISSIQLRPAPANPETNAYELVECGGGNGRVWPGEVAPVLGTDGFALSLDCPDAEGPYFLAWSLWPRGMADFQLGWTIESGGERFEFPITTNETYSQVPLWRAVEVPAPEARSSFPLIPRRSPSPRVSFPVSGGLVLLHAVPQREALEAAPAEPAP
ncbi:MAG: hypothetical protein SF028_02135 [Candidatus Sumerlaeia bacterium]|nr:hypothetical protein [Candidatus Sumerlaeia bacterium]